MGLRTFYVRFLMVVASIQIASANSATTCFTPISPLFASHPKCAQSCLGCLDSNESFAHACDINGDCCQGPKATAFIPLVYGCVKMACSSTDSQASWEEFLKNCARRGYPVSEQDTPSGYLYISFRGECDGPFDSPVSTLAGTKSIAGY